MSARWGEAIVAALCAPSIVTGPVVLAAALFPRASAAAAALAPVLVMSPMLLLTGSIAVILASVASLWLPGRRHVKLVLIGAGFVGWVIGFVLLLQPDLIELP
jgi:hypothetical protein